MQPNPQIAISTAQTWAIVIVALVLLVLVLWLIFGWRPRYRRRQAVAAERLFAQDRLGSWAHKRLSQWAPDERQTALRYYNGVGRQAKDGTIRADLVPANHHATIAALARQEGADEQSASRWADLLWLGERLEKRRSQAAASASVPRNAEAPSDAAASIHQFTETAAGDTSQVPTPTVDNQDVEADSTHEQTPSDITQSGDRRGSGHLELAAYDPSEDATDIDPDTELPASLVADDLTLEPDDELEDDVTTTIEEPTRADDQAPAAPPTIDNTSPGDTDVEAQVTRNDDPSIRSSEFGDPKPAVPAWILDARREIDRRSQTVSDSEVVEEAAEEVETGAEPVKSDTEDLPTPEAEAEAEVQAPPGAEEPASFTPSTLAEVLALDDVDSASTQATDAPIAAEADSDPDVDVDVEIEAGMVELADMADEIEQSAAAPIDATTVVAESDEIDDTDDTDDADDTDEATASTPGSMLDRAIADALLADDELRQQVKKLRRRAAREHELGIAQQRLGDRRLEQGRKKKAKAHYQSAKEHLAAAERLTHKAKKLQKKRAKARRSD